MVKDKKKYNINEIRYLIDKKMKFFFGAIIDFQVCQDNDLFRKRINEGIIQDKYFEMDDVSEEDKTLYEKYKGFFVFNEIYEKYSDYEKYEKLLSEYKGSDVDRYKSKIKPSCEVTSTRHIQKEINELIKEFPEEHKQYLKIIDSIKLNGRRKT